jgi:hypothetical protein
VSIEIAALMKKVDCGSYDFRTDVTSGTIVVGWQDNSIVTIAFNTFGVEPIAHTKHCWSVVKKYEISVAQPCLIAKYNYGMGGTEDWIGIRCKR